MSKTLAAESWTEAQGALPLVEHFECGAFERREEAWVHRKRVPFAVLARALRGRYAVCVEGERVDVEPGNYLLVPANREMEIGHTPDENGWMAVQWFHVRLRERGGLDPLEIMRLPLQVPEGISAELDELYLRARAILGTTECGRAGFLAASMEPALLARLELLELAAAIYRRALQLGKCRPSAWHIFPGGEMALERLLRHIDLHLGEPLTVQSLAREVNLSPSYFHEAFKAATGLTPMKFVRVRRLEAASRLLLASGAKLPEIGRSVGFADAFHFSHAFKAHYGVSPRNYRARTPYG